MTPNTTFATLRPAAVLAAAFLIAAYLGASPGPEEASRLFDAARSGDADAATALLDQGVPVDATDKYGSTALAMASSSGHADVVRLLLARGADVNHADAFYGARPVDIALFWKGHRDIAKILLEAGAEGREDALGLALREGDVDLARAAVASGPLYQSALQALRDRLGKLASEEEAPAQIAELLAGASSRPDPPTPSYDLEQLHTFTGKFEGWTSDDAVEVTLREGVLQWRLNDEARGALRIVGERAFAATDGSPVNFNGRSGRIEGVVVRAGDQSVFMRRSVAEPDPEAAARFAALEVTPEDAASSPNWPAFRGANAVGVADGHATAVSWNIGSGDGILWTGSLPGLGNSSPIVWGDRVYVTTAVADVEQRLRTGLTGATEYFDENVEHSWRVLAFDKRSGKLVWDVEVGRAVPLTKRHFKASQANSTPVTDGERIVVVFPTAGLACLDADGTVLWRKDLGGLNAGAFSDPTIEWGFASSPILYGDSVILQVDVHEGSHLVSWDLETGRELWRTERDVAPSWATPTILPGPEGDELVTNGSTIHAYDPKTGRELWSLGPNSELVVATPVVDGGVVYVSAGYPPIKPIYAVRAGTRGALDTQPGKAHDDLLWSHGRGGAYMPSPLLYRGLYYIVHHNGRLVAYDPADGTAVFKSRFSKGGTFTGSPVAADGKLYVPTEEGLLYVLEAGPAYSELAINDMGEPLMATPAISEGMLFLRTPSKLVAVAGAG